MLKSTLYSKIMLVYKPITQIGTEQNERKKFFKKVFNENVPRSSSYNGRKTLYVRTLEEEKNLNGSK